MRDVSPTNLVRVSGKQSEKLQRPQVQQFHLHMQQLIRNVAEDSSACTADFWSFWALYLEPILLRGCFQKEIYYKHFVKLIKLLCLCLQFEMTKKELTEV